MTLPQKKPAITLREWRESQGISQIDLAKNLRVSQQQESKVEKGFRSLSFQRKFRMQYPEDFNRITDFKR